MIGKLILAGGGSKEDSYELDKFFISLIPKRKKILYIPIAMDTRPYNECLDWFKSIINQFNFKNFEMLTELNKKIDLSNFGAIYIGGGNTFKLLKNIKESGFDKVLISFIKKGGIVYGGSAGAIILGKNILTCKDENKYIRECFEGLNLLKDISLWCHYRKKDDDIFKYIQETKNKVLALSEKTGIYFNNGKIKVIGESAFFFKETQKKELKPGIFIDLAFL